MCRGLVVRRGHWRIVEQLLLHTENLRSDVEFDTLFTERTVLQQQLDVDEATLPRYRLPPRRLLMHARRGTPAVRWTMARVMYKLHYFEILDNILSSLREM